MMYDPIYIRLKNNLSTEYKNWCPETKIQGKETDSSLISKDGRPQI